MSALPPQLIIFDCDGTLIDSEFIAAQAQEKLLNSYGVAITSEEIGRRFTGFTDTDMWAQLARERGTPFPDDMRVRYDTTLEALFRSDLRAIDGVTALLDGVDALGLARCVASNSSPERLRLTLGILGLWDRLGAHAYSSRLAAAPKPAPDVFFYAAAQMGVAAERCVVVEDSVAGVTGARAAGMPVIGFVGARHCEAGLDAVLLAAGAYCTVATLTDVLAEITRLVAVDATQPG